MAVAVVAVEVAESEEALVVGCIKDWVECRCSCCLSGVGFDKDLGWCREGFGQCMG